MRRGHVWNFDGMATSNGQERVPRSGDAEVSAGRQGSRFAAAAANPWIYGQGDIPFECRPAERVWYEAFGV